MICESHDSDVLICSCGYENTDHLPPAEVMISEDFHETWEGLWDKKRINKEWKLWPDSVREVYVYWRELALDFTDDRELAANFAVEKALIYRRSMGSGTSDRRLDEKQLELS